MRHYSLLDTLLQNLPTQDRLPSRPSPAAGLPEGLSDPAEKRYAARLMRVNHTGEVCAQALYKAQAYLAHDPKMKTHLQDAAKEEEAHLAWCAERLGQLEAKPSLLNPLWYLGSVTVGGLAALLGDKWSLGFLAETEHQVSEHLRLHLKHLPARDIKSRRILEKMLREEEEHAREAEAQGGQMLPFEIRQVMRWGARLMTLSARVI